MKTKIGIIVAVLFAFMAGQISFTAVADAAAKLPKTKVIQTRVRPPDVTVGGVTQRSMGVMTTEYLTLVGTSYQLSRRVSESRTLFEKDNKKLKDVTVTSTIDFIGVNKSKEKVYTAVYDFVARKKTIESRETDYINGMPLYQVVKGAKDEVVSQQAWFYAGIKNDFISASDLNVVEKFISTYGVAGSASIQGYGLDGGVLVDIIFNDSTKNPGAPPMRSFQILAGGVKNVTTVNVLNKDGKTAKTYRLDGSGKIASYDEYIYTPDGRCIKREYQGVNNPAAEDWNKGFSLVRVTYFSPAGDVWKSFVPVKASLDILKNGAINERDLSLARRYIQQVADGTMLYSAQADFNGDGLNDDNDIAVIEGYIGADINRDGKVDAKDKMLLQSVIESIKSGSGDVKPEVLMSADLNKDGQVDSADVDTMNGYLSISAQTFGETKMDAGTRGRETTTAQASGDVNADGIVNAMDKMLLQSVIESIKSGAGGVRPAVLNAADLNKDGKVDDNDIVVINGYLAASELPVDRAAAAERPGAALVDAVKISQIDNAGPVAVQSQMAEQTTQVKDAGAAVTPQLAAKEPEVKPR